MHRAPRTRPLRVQGVEHRLAVIDLGVELVPARRLHVHRRVVEADGRDLRARARRRAAGGQAGRSSPSRWSARWRRSSCSPTSAARPGSSGCGRSPRRRSARRRNREAFVQRRARAGRAGRSRCCARERGGPLRLPRRRSTRPRSPTASRSTSAAARCSSRTSATRRAQDAQLVAARRRRDDGALPRRRALKPKHLKALRDHVRDELEQAPWLARRARAGWPGIGGTVRNLAAAADARARSCPPTASRASRSGRDDARRAGRAARRDDAGRAAPRPGHQARARRPDPRRRGRRPDA